MADRLRIVTFSPGGRPIVQMDLNDTTTYSLVGGTLALAAPARQQQWSQAIQRYQGSLLARESHDNGTLTAEWYISGAGIADTAKDKMELLMAQFESVTEGRYLEWRQENSTRSTYYAIRGPAPWEFMYRWIEFQAVKTLHVKGGWTIAPLAEGDRMEIDDPFDVDSITDYTFDTGAGTIAVSGGQLVPSTTALKKFRHTSRGYAYGDVQLTLKYKTGASASTTGTFTRLMAKWQDANNYLIAGTRGDGSLVISRVTAGSLIDRAATAVTALSANTTYWVRFRIEGNTLIAEHWTAAPTPMGTPANAVTYTLSTGAEQTQFGSTVTGGIGAELTLPGTDYSYGPFTVEPYVYQNRTLPATLPLAGAIPGDAPAATTATVTHLGGAAAPIWAMLGWTKRAKTGYNLVQVGDFEFGINGLWSTAAVGNINAAATSFTRTVSSSAKYGSTLAQIVVPGTVSLEGPNYPIFRTFKKGVSYTAQVWVRATSGAGINMTLRFGDGPNGDAATSSVVSVGTGAMQLLTVTWTPAADRTVGYIGVGPSAATALTYQIDGVMAYETALGAPTGYANNEGRGGMQPFGIFESENAGLVTSWPTTPTASATYQNGRGLELNMASVNFAETVHWLDPSLITADDMYRGDVEVEVWVRAQIPSTASALILTASAVPLSGVSVAGGGRYTREFGSSGKTLVSQIPVGSSATRFIRAGTITMNTSNSIQWGLRTRFDWNSTASTGTLGLDYIVLVPVRGRASSATGQTQTGGYGAFIQSASVETSKVIYPQLRGAAGGPTGPAFPDTGLGGAPLWLAPGDNDVLVKLSSLIPDDTFAQSTAEQLSHAATVKLSPIPRYFITRGS